MMDLNLITLILAGLALGVAIVALILAWIGVGRSKRKLQAMELLLKELLKARDSARKQLNELHSSAYLGDPEYVKRWERKQAWYRNNGILPLAEGSGPNGTLIVTQDNENGGISSQEIQELIKRIFS